MKTKIYTFSHNRPDFIELQYQTIKKYLQDDFEFIVFNNEKPGSDGGYDPNRISQIDIECKKLNLECIKIPFDQSLQVLNGELMFTGNQYTGGAAACAYSLSWAWKNIISKDQGISVVIDSDMFLCNPISFQSMMKGYNFAYFPSYRNNLSIMYPWNGIVIVDPKNMPNVQNMSWGPGLVDGTNTDVGGELHYYRKKYKNELKELYIDMWGYLVDTDPYVEISINGCAQYFLNFDRKHIEIRDPRTPPFNINNKSFPHQKDRSDYLNYFIQNCEYLKQFRDKFNFPKPSYFDLIKLEKNDLISDAFIIHYKSASNYQPWASSEYNFQKTEVFKHILNT